jgi:hypothetical protein
MVKLVLAHYFNLKRWPKGLHGMVTMTMMMTGMVMEATRTVPDPLEGPRMMQVMSLTFLRRCVRAVAKMLISRGMSRQVAVMLRSDRLLGKGVRDHQRRRLRGHLLLATTMVPRGKIALFQVPRMARCRRMPLPRLQAILLLLLIR